MKVNLGNVNMNRKVEAGDLIVVGHKSPYNEEINTEVYIACVDGDFSCTGLSLENGVSTLGDFTTFHALMENLRNNPMVDKLSILSKEQYQLTMQLKETEVL